MVDREMKISIKESNRLLKFLIKNTTTIIIKSWKKLS